MDALPGVRTFVREAAARARLSDERAFDLTVAASEACANAIEHSGAKDQELCLEARIHRGGLTVRIDSHGDFRLDGKAETSRDRGMGLPLMVMLTDDLAIHRHPRGGLSVLLTISTPGGAALQD
jgi:anti-sigma regulatory factor (Ser/Thr protein kinase)